jgi:hypothetical protein
MLNRYTKLLSSYREINFDFIEYAKKSNNQKYNQYSFINPLALHWQEHIDFLNRFYKKNSCRNLIIGLNPGKNGCNKTSVAFTDPTAARTFLKMNITADTIRESSSEKLYPIFLEVFNQDIGEFFNHYHLTNLLPFGVTRPGKVKDINVKFRELISIPDFEKIAKKHVNELISIYKPKFIIAVGQDVQMFLRKILRTKFPEVIIIGAVHPAYDSHFTEVERQRWIHLITTFK